MPQGVMVGDMSVSILSVGAEVFQFIQGIESRYRIGGDGSSGTYDDFIQIDAPVNKGNSGGPSFNTEGEVIGVNTAIYSPSGGNVGIAFSIPASTVKSVVGQLNDRLHASGLQLSCFARRASRTDNTMPGLQQ
jgi:S1-C subfamily serine protease